MKIVYVSNFMNHHQLPLCLNLYNMVDVDFTFISMTPISRERLKLGYKDMNRMYPFVFCAYDSSQHMKIAIDLIDDADVTIYGSCPDYLLFNRAKKGKLCFKFSERFFKEGIGFLDFPRNLASALKHLKPLEKLPVYFCCSSAYTAADLNRYTNFKGKTFKWGYYPEFVKYNIDDIMKNKESVLTKNRNNDFVSLLWVGRFIDWKHPEKAIYVAEHLKQKGYNFKLTFIGTGILEHDLKNLVKEKGLENSVLFLGALTPEEVRKHMEKSDVYLFTSDFNEGWGAVLNESMNSGCAVVASHAIGSVPFLIQNGYNGLIYENGNLSSLIAQVEKLFEQQELRDLLGRNAYKTISEIWNAKKAANRFHNLAQCLLNENKIGLKLYDNGPCSVAECLKNGWFRDENNKG